MICDFMTKCNYDVQNSKLNVVFIEKESKQYLIIDITCSADKVCNMEEKKVDRYNKLIWEVKQSISTNKVVAVPMIIIEAIETASKIIEYYIIQIGPVTLAENCTFWNHSNTQKDARRKDKTSATIEHLHR